MRDQSITLDPNDLGALRREAQLLKDRLPGGLFD